MKAKKILKIIAFVSLIIILAMGTAIYLKIGELNKDIAEIQVGSIDLSRIDDGVYNGEYYYSYMLGAKVKVTVKGNKITSIDLIDHKYGLGGKAEIITDRVIDSQDLSVDSVSGATASSKIILKAIEDALN